MTDRPGVLVGKTVVVRSPDKVPAYFGDLHRVYVGSTGVVHAIVATEPRDNPLVKVKFPPGDRIVFFRLSELDVQVDAPSAPGERHGTRASHLPK